MGHRSRPGAHARQRRWPGQHALSGTPAGMTTPELRSGVVLHPDFLRHAMSFPMARAIQKEEGIPSGDYSESSEKILATGTPHSAPPAFPGDRLVRKRSSCIWTTAGGQVMGSGGTRRAPTPMLGPLATAPVHRLRVRDAWYWLSRVRGPGELRPPERKARTPRQGDLSRDS